MYFEMYGLYLIFGIILSIPIFPKLRKFILDDKFKNNVFVNVIYYVFVLFVFFVSVCYLSESTYNPFIYFRF